MSLSSSFTGACRDPKNKHPTWAGAGFIQDIPILGGGGTKEGGYRGGGVGASHIGRKGGEGQIGSPGVGL